MNSQFAPYVTQVVFAHEELGHPPDVIMGMFGAQIDGFSVAVVEAILAEHSKKYRSHLRMLEAQTRARGGVTTEQADEALSELMEQYLNLALASDNDLVRERALKFLINEKKGRNDIPEKLLKLKQRDTEANEVNTAMKVEEFNRRMRENRELIEKAMGGLSQPQKAPLGELVNS